LWVGWSCPHSKIEFIVGSVFLSFALGCSHLPKNSILSAKRQFSACFSNCSNSLNFKDKINCNTTKQNDLKWGKTYTGLKFDLVHFNGPQTKFICDSLYKHPVLAWWPQCKHKSSPALYIFNKICNALMLWLILNK